MKIGFFDSGIGGLSVLHYALSALPKEQFIYYADEAHVPYGEKTPEQVMGYVEEIVEFMLEKHVKAIVLACNTATSVSVRALREKYKIPIIGMEPAIKKAVDLYGEKKILVAATPITVKGEKMKNLVERVDHHHLSTLIPFPKLVRFAEQGEFDSKAVMEHLKEVFSNYELTEYASLVLGCTHFNYFKDCFRKVLPDTIHFVDGIEGTVSQLIRKLKEIDGLEHLDQTVEYYFSGEAVTKEEEQKRIEGLLKRLDAMQKIN